MKREEKKTLTSAEFVKGLFNQISKDYDKLNDIMSFGVHRKIKKEIVKQIKFYEPFTLHPSPFTFLDLCTGTGDIAGTLKEKFPQAKIIGLDFSEKMLEIARKKHSDIEFLQGDCTSLPFEDESFDICTVAFGLRNVDFIAQSNQKNERQSRLGFLAQQHELSQDLAAQNHGNLEKAIREIHRVLKKDGIFINLDLGKPNKFFNLFLKPYMYVWVAILGKIFHGDETPYKYLAQSNETFPAPKELMEIYKKAGFGEIKNKNYLFGQIASQHCVKS